MTTFQLRVWWENISLSSCDRHKTDEVSGIFKKLAASFMNDFSVVYCFASSFNVFMLTIAQFHDRFKRKELLHSHICSLPSQNIDRALESPRGIPKCRWCWHIFETSAHQNDNKKSLGRIMKGDCASISRLMFDIPLWRIFEASPIQSPKVPCVANGSRCRSHSLNFIACKWQKRPERRSLHV